MGKTKPSFTKQEFMEMEAQKAGMPLSKFKKIMKAVPCNCGHWVCKGWLIELKTVSKC